MEINCRILSFEEENKIAFEYYLEEDGPSYMFICFLIFKEINNRLQPVLIIKETEKTIIGNKFEDKKITRDIVKKAFIGNLYDEILEKHSMRISWPDEIIDSNYPYFVITKIDNKYWMLPDWDQKKEVNNDR